MSALWFDPIGETWRKMPERKPVDIFEPGPSEAARAARLASVRELWNAVVNTANSTLMAEPETCDSSF